MGALGLNDRALAQLLDAIATGVVTPGEVVERLRAPAGGAPDTTAFARPDHGRDARTGMPEVIFSLGKTPDQVREVARSLLERSSAPVIATKASRAVYDAVAGLSPESEFHEASGTIVLRRERGAPIGRVAVVTAGTSDLAIAEEAAVVAEACGVKVERIADVGVAGIHRVLGVADALNENDVLIVVAGMEGALPSVVAGLVRVPVVAVPTSIGYGASFGGLAALLGMLNSCAPGVAVVNIDNGFGAAAFAIRLLKARAA